MTTDVQCTIDALAQSDGDNDTLQTKASKLIYKVIGQNADLIRFDQLRVMFREQLQHKKRKPTVGERKEYEILTTKLQNYVLSCKYKAKSALKGLEMECIAKKGLQVDTTNPTYNKLLKELELAKKVLSIWSHFKI